jgi:Fic family protein
MLDWINDRRRPALERAAYALWRLNWTHPFRGGNGRTSRCIAYLILCMDLGLMMPGLPTLPTLIYERRDDYVAALRAADASARVAAEQDEQSQERAKEPDLTLMSAYLKDLVLQQLANAVARLASPTQ